MQWIQHLDNMKGELSNRKYMYIHPPFSLLYHCFQPKNWPWYCCHCCCFRFLSKEGQWLGKQKRNEQRFMVKHVCINAPLPWTWLLSNRLLVEKQESVKNKNFFVSLLLLFFLIPQRNCIHLKFTSHQENL